MDIVYGIIYKATCLVNNKIYIGKTEQDLKIRMSSHFSDAESFRLDTHFARAIRKYGRDNFKFEEIDKATNSLEELNEKERYWINYYDSANKGYNETDGGEGGNTYKYKTKEEMDIIKDKIRETKIGSKNPHSVRIKAKNIETKEEIFFNTMIDCQKYFNEKGHHFCSKRCRNITELMYKGKWMFAYENQEYNPNYHSKKSYIRSIPIQVKNLITGEIKQFDTYTDAGQYCGKSARQMSKIMKDYKKPFVKGDYEFTKL